MLKSMIKQRAGLLALLVAAGFLMSEVVGFVNPQEAMAAVDNENDLSVPEGTVGE